MCYFIAKYCKKGGCVRKGNNGADMKGTFAEPNGTSEQLGEARWIV